MKTILAIIGLLALTVSALQAQAPTYDCKTLCTDKTVAAATGTNVNYVMDVRKQASVAVQATFTMSAAGTTNTSFFFQRSLDGSTWDTTGYLVSVVTAGTTTQSLLTNLPTYGAGYMRLSWWTNGFVTGTMTNTVKYGIKISAP